VKKLARIQNSDFSYPSKCFKIGGHVASKTIMNWRLYKAKRPPADATPTRRRRDADATRIGQWALVDDADATTTRRKVGKTQFLNILTNSNQLSWSWIYAPTNR
jgi:hypothetical protein